VQEAISKKVEQVVQTEAPIRALSVVTPCYNEEGNVRELYERVKKVLLDLPQYTYEHIFIDNASRDKTVDILREIAAEDQRVKVIVNARNFGQVRSPYWAILQANGDAVIGLAADLQDPPELIQSFVTEWEKGSAVVLGVKATTEEGGLMAWARRRYYSTLATMSDVEIVANATGFGLYDRRVVEIIRDMRDPNPYFRGLLAEIGLPIAQIPYAQPNRAAGSSSNNFFTLFDLAMLGMTTLGGFALAAASLFLAFAYLVAKLLFWDYFPMGVAPIVIGLFFTFSVQLFFIGMLGEYVASIHTHVVRRPIVVELERINFGSESSRAFADQHVAPEEASGTPNESKDI